MATRIHAEASSGERASTPRTWFDNLVRVETRLYNALNDDLRRTCRITTSQYEFLDHLARHPGARVVDLAGCFAVGLGATSKGIDRLIAAGWVRREPNPADGRSSLLHLTVGGVRLVEEARVVVDEALERLAGSVVTPADLSRVRDVLSVLRARLEADRAGTPAG